jgi:DNA-directed RNA polymerase specialized sigma24 family protein
MTTNLTPKNSAEEEAPQAPVRTGIIDHAVGAYGDLLFDLCETVLWSASNAQIAFRMILKDIRRSHKSNPFENYERAWVLRVACTKLRNLAEQHGRRLSPSEQVMLDAGLGPSAKLKQFDSYFHRLGTDDQMLLLLKDKYGIPYDEIAAALGSPEGSLKVRRQQALRTLEEWLWDQV